MRKRLFRQDSSGGLSGFGDGVCRQEFRKMCDMDEILRTFRVTGVLPHVAGLCCMPCDQFLYGDYAEDVANPLCEEVNRDKDELEVVHGDSKSDEDSGKTSSSVEEKVVGVKGESPVADA